MVTCNILEVWFDLKLFKNVNTFIYLIALHIFLYLGVRDPYIYNLQWFLIH